VVCRRLLRADEHLLQLRKGDDCRDLTEGGYGDRLGQAGSEEEIGHGWEQKREVLVSPPSEASQKLKGWDADAQTRTVLQQVRLLTGTISISQEPAAE